MADVRTIQTQCRKRHRTPKEPAEVLWRSGKEKFHICEKMPPSQARTEHISEGIRACERAIELDPQLADAHKWLAVLIGLRAKEQNISEQYADAVLFKNHLDIALQLNPNDSYLYYMLGRYEFELADLPAWKRNAASIFCWALPNPSYKDALDHLREANRLADKRFKANDFMIGKCYIALGQYKIGFDWLKRANEIPTRNDATETIEHIEINTEIHNLLNKYKSYNI